MADKETGLNIPISVVADKDSAKVALNELTKSVLSSLKDGYIEVPAEIKASYTRGSKELEKAQKDVIKSYEKMSKEGFSSSTEELDNLIEKYKKFKSLAGKEGKANSKQTKWLTKTIGETLQPYLTQKRELEKVLASFETSVTKIEKTAKKTNIKKPRNFGSHSKEEKGIESTGPKGYKTNSGIDAGKTNPHEMYASEFSGHRSPQERQFALSKKEAKKKFENPSLKSDKYNSIEELNTELQKRREKDPKLKNRSRKIQVKPGESPTWIEDKTWETSWSHKSRKMSPAEKANDLSEDLRNNFVPKLLDQIQKSTDETEIESLFEKFSKTIDVIANLNSQAGKSTLSDIKQTVGLVMSKLGYSVFGKVGFTNGDDKTAKSKDPKIEALLKSFLNKIDKKTEQIEKETIEIEKAIKKSTTKTNNKRVTDNNSIANKIVTDSKTSTSTQSDLQAVTKEVKNNTDTVKTQIDYDNVAAADEQISDRKQIKGNRTLIDETKKDAATGMNTDANADRLFKELDEIKQILSGPMPPQKTPEEIDTSNNLPDLYRYFENGEWVTAGVKEDEDNRPTVKFKEDKTNHQELYKRRMQQMRKNTIIFKRYSTDFR